MIDTDIEFPELRPIGKLKKAARQFSLHEYCTRQRGGAEKVEVRRWKNPLNISVAFEVCLEPINESEKLEQQHLLRTITFQSGEIRELPKVYDVVIWRVLESIIIGGLCPCLLAVDLVDAPVAVAAISDGWRLHLPGWSEASE